MDPILITICFIAIIVLLLLFGAPTDIMKYTSKGVVKLIVGALFIFFANVFGSSFGLHIPINLFTSAIAGFLGLFGLGSLIAIHYFILP